MQLCQTQTSEGARLDGSDGIIPQVEITDVIVERQRARNNQINLVVLHHQLIQFAERWDQCRDSPQSVVVQPQLFQ